MYFGIALHRAMVMRDDSTPQAYLARFQNTIIAVQGSATA
jgi:hypothetical protein